MTKFKVWKRTQVHDGDSPALAHHPGPTNFNSAKIDCPTQLHELKRVWWRCHLSLLLGDLTGAPRQRQRKHHLDVLRNEIHVI